MKNQITLLFLFLSISIFGQTELNLDWERVTDIPGRALAITMSGDTMYAYTKTSVFYSLDMGDIWELSCTSTDSEYELLTHNSFSVILKKIEFNDHTKSWGLGLSKGQTSYSSTVEETQGCTKKISTISDIQYSFFSNHGGSGKYLDYKSNLSQYKFLDDGTLIYHRENVKKDHFVASKGGNEIENHGEEFFIFDKKGQKTETRIAYFDKKVKQSGQIIYNNSTFIENYKYIPFIIGHTNNKFIAISDSFYIEMTEDFKILKKILRPEAHFSWHKFFRTAYSDSEVFLLTNKNKLYRSLDQGENWIEKQFNFDKDFINIKK